MRLSCPNCGAQYEVPDEVIPVAGRDVQCSNCGDTWFQRHKDALEDDIAVTGEVGEFDQNAEAGVTEASTQEQSWDASADETTDQIADVSEEDDSGPAEREGEADQIFAAADEDEPQGHPETHAAPETSQGRPQRQTLDPEISNVLREEAALEATARANEGSGGLESQPDLGLAEPESGREGGAARRAQEARVRMARMRGEPDPPLRRPDATVDTSATNGAMAGSRRDLLPDIEEINSTLRSTKDRRTVSDAQDPASPESLPQQRRRRGFRRGFSIMLLLTTALILGYVYAPVISAKIPELASSMSLYVENVNTARLWLDTQMSAVLVWLDMKAIGGA